MPRQKLSEYRAKKILTEALGLPYQGWSIDARTSLGEQLSNLPADGQFVVKVDEGVKGRFKRGLVVLNVSSTEVEAALQSLIEKGFQRLIVEPMAAHEEGSERYISLISERQGTVLRYTANGGVDVEAHPESMKQVRLNEQTDWAAIASETSISPEQLQALIKTFHDDYFTFLEINPYVVSQAGLQLLDAAVEVDDAASFFVSRWQADDFRQHTEHGLSPEESEVAELAANSPASFNLSLLEPNGSVFLLLSGGGASVVVADEVYNQGYGKQLANYGEYSGNPTSEETYLYTKSVLQLLLQSQAPKKVLFIGGAVANFTDIAKTFTGVIQAIEEVAEQLREQGVKVFVRRGGPNQEVGLARIEAVLKKHELLGAVHSPKTPLTVAVREALEVVHE